jgi:hypothetical protein
MHNEGINVGFLDTLTHCLRLEFRADLSENTLQVLGERLLVPFLNAPNLCLAEITCENRIITGGYGNGYPARFFLMEFLR